MRGNVACFQDVPPERNLPKAIGVIVAKAPDEDDGIYDDEAHEYEKVLDDFMLGPLPGCIHDHTPFSSRIGVVLLTSRGMVASDAFVSVSRLWDHT